jgi:hypothetical protein
MVLGTVRLCSAKIPVVVAEYILFKTPWVRTLRAAATAWRPSCPMEHSGARRGRNRPVVIGTRELFVCDIGREILNVILTREFQASATAHENVRLRTAGKGDGQFVIVVVLGRMDRSHLIPVNASNSGRCFSFRLRPCAG